jgi:hypothetical protein
LKADRKAYQDQKQVQKLGNQRGDGSTGNAHSGGTQLSEDVLHLFARHVLKIFGGKLFLVQ